MGVLHVNNQRRVLSADDQATVHRILFSAAEDNSCRADDIRWLARKLLELQPSAEELMRQRLKRLRTAEKLCQFRLFQVTESGDGWGAWTVREERISRSIADLIDVLAEEATGWEIGGPGIWRNR